MIETRRNTRERPFNPKVPDRRGRELSTQFDRQIGLPRWRAGEGSKLKDLHTTELSARARYS